MGELTKIELKSITTQNDLMTEIISNFGSINYAITSVANTALDNLTTAQYNSGKEKVVPLTDQGETFTISKAKYDEVVKALRMLKEKGYWDQLNSVTKTAVPENEIKIAILKKLQ